MSVTALAVREPPVRPGGGGIAARRAVVRWTWRLFRREWRQQTILLVLITFTVSAALFSVIAAYNLPSSGDARFGTADHIVSLTNPQPAALTVDVGALSTKYGPVETIGHARVPIPGSVNTFDLRTQDPRGLYNAATLALRHGRYPTGSDEVAITAGVASTFGLHIGDTSSFAGFPATVVGLVENPKDLSDDFVLASRSHFATATTVTILVRGHGDDLGNQSGSVRQFQVSNAETAATSETPGGVEKGTAALLVLALDTVVMLLVSLVAAAGFVVVAQRRLRQLGMLASIGATSRHLRLAMMAHGVATGVVAAIAGNVIALVGWVALSSRLESAAGHRINRADIPWWALVGGTLLAVLTTTAAAWWPARTAARVPVTRALSGRPPRPKRAHRSAIAAVAFLAVGFACLSWGIDTNGKANAAALIAGLIAIVLGVMFLAPIAVRALGATAPRFPVAVRLALRDLARQQARAGAALAAVSLGLGIAFTAIIVTTAAAPRAGTGNLSDRQLLMRLDDGEAVQNLTVVERDRLESDIDHFVASLGGAVVYPLDMAVSSNAGGVKGTGTIHGASPTSGGLGRPGTPAIILGERIPNGVTGSADLYVASPELLSRFGVDLASVDPSAEVLTPRSGNLVLLDVLGDERPDQLPAPRIQTIRDPGYTDVPQTFITEAAMAAHGWTSMRAGWFIESSHRLTNQQRADARALAARSGMVAAARDPQHGLVVTRNVATLVGMLLALGILAMTVGLIRSEAAQDLQTLTAAGAASVVRRAIAATTAAALALLGAAVGLIGAYTALIAGYLDDLHRLARIPWLHLVLIVVGLPAIAGAAAWLLAGREPPTIARRAMG